MSVYGEPKFEYCTFENNSALGKEDDETFDRNDDTAGGALVLASQSSSTLVGEKD